MILQKIAKNVAQPTYIINTVKLDTKLLEKVAQKFAATSPQSGHPVQVSNCKTRRTDFLLYSQGDQMSLRKNRPKCT
jgi:hypothetical protein